MDDRHVDTPFGLGQRWTVPHTPAWRRFLWIAAGLLLVLLIVWVATHLMSSTTRTGRIGGNGPVPVGVSKVVNGDIRVTIDGLGAVTPLATVTVHPQVTGLSEEDRFHRRPDGQGRRMLAEIDPRPYQAALDQAKGQLARDEATARPTPRSISPATRRCGKQNAISRANLCDADRHGPHRRRHRRSRQGRRRSRRRSISAYCRITSPVAGRVGIRQVDVGNLVADRRPPRSSS